MIILLVIAAFVLVLTFILIKRHRKDTLERKQHELAAVSKPFSPPSTLSQKLNAIKIHLLLSAWLLKKNSNQYIEKQQYIEGYLNEKFKIEKVEVLIELNALSRESIHIRSVANWVISSMSSKEQRTELIEFLIALLFAAKTDLIDREFTALVRFAELIGVQGVFVEKRIIDYRKSLWGASSGESRWHAFTDKQVRRKIALAVLGLLGDATEKEIKTAYRELAKKYHPDVYRATSESHDETTANRFLEIQEAYEELNGEL